MSSEIDNAELGITDAYTEFLERYCERELARLGSEYPSCKEFVIDYDDLYKYDHELAENLTVCSEDELGFFADAIREYNLPVDVDGVDVRVINAYPNKTVDELRAEDTGMYLSVTGQVDEVSQVQPEIVEGKYNCLNCGLEVEKDSVGGQLVIPQYCQECEMKGFELNESRSEIMDKQEIVLTSLPEENGGETREDLRVDAYGELAGVVRPGDRLRVNGVLEMDTESIKIESNPESIRPFVMESNGFQREQESYEQLSPDRVDEIKSLSDRGDLFQLLIDSFAPHILTDEYGDMMKLGMMLQQFGGVRHELPTGDSKKSDINILLVGDPGTAKSQYLNTAYQLAPKGVKASGKGASAAGLTATAVQSDLTGGWSLKPGALVLANNGLACIDEFDKMKAETRKSMHEALEDQEIPVSKAGMNVTLPAKCSVLAASNPELGRYDRMQPLSEQVDLGPTLISRFDLIFGLADSVDESLDRRVSMHQLRTDDDALEPAIETELLREYIAHARQNVHPSWEDGVRESVAEYYVSIRQESEDEYTGSGVGPRLTDALRRLSEASARARLSEVVMEEDVERACELYDFHIGMVALDQNGNISPDKLDGEHSFEQKRVLKTQKDQREAIMATVREQHEPISADMLASTLGLELDVVEGHVESLLQQKERGLYEPESGRYDSV